VPVLQDDTIERKLDFMRLMSLQCNHDMCERNVVATFEPKLQPSYGQLIYSWEDTCLLRCDKYVSNRTNFMLHLVHCNSHLSI